MEKDDIRLMIGNVKFSCRAVGVIIKNNKILFQKRKGDENWALPGGAIATLETGEEVVLRELEEETGEKNAVVERPLWFTEYFFEFGGKVQHQYILGYLVNIPDSSKLMNNDEFKKDIKKSSIKPDFLKNKLTNVKKTYEHIIENDL